MKYRKLLIVLCAFTLIVPQSSAQNCGRRRTSRIVNGVTTGVNEFTMMCGLTQGSAFVFCGCTILANYYVLSSAHCIVGKSATSLQVLVGDHDYKIGTDTPYATLIPVQSYLNHPGFNSNTNLNDISIIKTQRSITYNVAIGPVCLPPTNLLFTNSLVEAVGWGSTGYGYPVSSVLKKVSLTVVSNAQCNSYYNNQIQPSQMCTYASGRDSCQYDSGGPVFVTMNGLVYLAGVITAGSGCATSSPSINTRVTSYVTWIKQNTPGAVYY